MGLLLRGTAYGTGHFALLSSDVLNGQSRVAGLLEKKKKKKEVPGQCDVLRKPLMPADSPGRGQDTLCLQAACSTLQPTNTTDAYLYIQPDYCADLQHFSFFVFSIFSPGQIITETTALLDTFQAGQRGICCKYQARIRSHTSTWDHVVQHSVASTARFKGRCERDLPTINTPTQELRISLHSVTRFRKHRENALDLPIHLQLAMALLFIAMVSSPL